MVIDVDLAARLAQLPIACAEREYPNAIGHVLRGPGDAGTPKRLHPAFYGCFDWHSAVHGHWTLARLCRLVPDGTFVGRARQVLSRNLTAEKIAAEVAYLRDRPGFERPYGLAWLLCLAGELRQWDDPDAERWSAALRPLEALAAEHLRSWLPRLTHPIRSGEHSQTAFALGLAFDWAVTAGDPLRGLIAERARTFHLDDVEAPIGYEPSGHDFLSPALAEADLMRRVLPQESFTSWLRTFLPEIPEETLNDWLPVASSSDPTDGKLAHLDGLCLSRAWMLEAIADALLPEDRRRYALQAAARSHRRAGLEAVTGEHYAGGHWLGTFAVYLLTRGA